MPTAPGTRRSLGIAALLFALAAVVRVLFVVATPDRTAGFSAFYKGDAPVWIEAVQAGTTGELPFRPPGMRTWLELLWDGTLDGLSTARLLHALAGALLAPLVFWGLRRVGTVPAVCAGGLTALATGQVMLSASLNNEVPYLLLAFTALCLMPRAASAHEPWWALLFGGVQGLACLVRAEHLLFTLAGAAWLALRRGRAGFGHGAGRAALSLLAAIVVMTPWHVIAWQRVAHFNRTESPARPARTLPWDEAAVTAVTELPGFVRASAQRFVEAVVRHRGGTRVAAGDPEALFDEAFGYWPEPLPGAFFVALYGPLNFRLANGPEADGGFSRAALDAPPRLLGGPPAWPPQWLAGLPGDGQLALEYPPHVQMLRDGYALGWQWIREHPGAAAQLARRKLAILWSGAAHGLGGSGFPIGNEGLRRRVDLSVPEGAGATAWRIAWLAVTAVGAILALRRRDASRWLLWAACVAVAGTLFFGYARQGALLAPVLGACAGFVVERTLRARPAAIAGGVLVALVFALDLVRALDPPTVFVGGRAIDGAGDGWPPHEYEERHVELR